MSSSKIGDVGFTWWRVWSWLCLVGGTLALVMSLGKLGGWTILLVGLNIFVSIFMLQYSRAAFLTMTILSLNPLTWIINGIYLKNRWNHPLVLAGSGRDNSMNPTAPLITPTSSEFGIAAVVATVTAAKNNNDVYQYAAEEIESGNIDKGLWARLFSEADGDENRTRARYIKERVTMMRSS